MTASTPLPLARQLEGETIVLAPGIYDALTALIGRPTTGSSSAGDSALLAAAGAQRARPDIRAVLAAEDAAFRRRNQGLILDRLFGVFTEGERYARYKLDAEAELLRLRARGVWVPQLPPKE